MGVHFTLSLKVQIRIRRGYMDLNKNTCISITLKVACFSFICIDLEEQSKSDILSILTQIRKQSKNLTYTLSGLRFDRYSNLFSVVMTIKIVNYCPKPFKQILICHGLIVESQHIIITTVKISKSSL